MTLKLTGVVRRYAGNPEPTLRGVELELAAGTLVAVLGQSGAGKSTVLRCVMGLEPFERGEVSVDGLVVSGTEQVSRREREQQVVSVRRRLGLVFQSFELFPHLTALENCTLAPVKVRGLSVERARRKAEELLDQLGLTERMHAYPEQLSGGQKQRVAICRALAMEPRVLLYDEPTSALDPSMKHEVVQTLKRVDETGVTQVVVTHDLALAKSVELVCVLHEGRVVEQGPPSEVLVAPQHEGTKGLLKAWMAEP